MTPSDRGFTHSLPAGQQTYVVLPAALIAHMPLPWRHAMAQILEEFHRAWAHLSPPEYRVVPSRRERLVNLDEDQLAEVGFIAEIDAEGQLVYRDRRTGVLVANPESTEVLVPYPDPIPAERDLVAHDTSPRGFPAPPIQQPARGA